MARDWAEIFGPGEWKTINHHAVYVRYNSGPVYNLRDALKEATYKPQHEIVNGINVSNVTDEYVATAKPGKGKIYVQSGTSKYEIQNGSPNKKKIRDETVQAQWLIDKFGGDVTIVRPNVSNKYHSYPNGTVSPDYIWNHERFAYWELKEPENPANGKQSYRKGMHQIGIKYGEASGNAGGLVVKINDRRIPIENVKSQIADRFRQSLLTKMDAIVKYNDAEYTILRFHK